MIMVIAIRIAGFHFQKVVLFEFDYDWKECKWNVKERAHTHSQSSHDDDDDRHDDVGCFQVCEFWFICI